MILFNLSFALFIVLVTLLPGILISFALFKGREEFAWVEKLLIGAGLSFFCIPLIPFLLNAFLDKAFHFNYVMDFLNLGFWYVVSAAFFIYRYNQDFNPSQIWSGISSRLKTLWDKGDYVGFMKYIGPWVLLVVVLFSFVLRLSTLTPIYQELDPYFYMYSATLILTHGYVPQYDITAWYPVVKSTHRTSPLLAYMEATWFRLYAHQGYSPYLLSYIANIYPPIAAALAVFFVVLGLSAFYDRWYGILGGVVLTLASMFFMKTVAGVAEAQPFAFLSLSMFFAFLCWMIRTKEELFALLTGVGYFMVLYGCSSSPVAIALATSAIAMLAVFNAITQERARLMTNIRLFAILFGCVVVSLLVDFVWMPPGALHRLIYTSTPLFGGLLAACVLYALMAYEKQIAEAIGFSYELFDCLDRVDVGDAEKKIQSAEKTLMKKDTRKLLNRLAVVVVLAIVGYLVVRFTPLNAPVSTFIRSSFDLTVYRNALLRTIQEQALAGADLSNYGAFAYPFGSTKGFFASVITTLSTGPTALMNEVVGLVGWFVRDLSHSGVLNYIPKKPGLYGWVFLTILVGFVVSIIHRLYDRRAGPIFFLFLALFPILFIGLVKVKFGIYLIWATTILFVSALGEIAAAAHRLLKKNGRMLHYVMLFVLLCFSVIAAKTSVAKYIVPVMFAPRFQDNPAAVAPRLIPVCKQLQSMAPNDPVTLKVCDAAHHPVAFANESINNQYDQYICILSQLGKLPTKNDTTELIGAELRCTRLLPYWVSTMEWIRTKTPPGARITSWWDYGHWINFFGERNAVIRNEHRSHKMIKNIAYDYIMASPEKLAHDMEYYNSTYAMFDTQLIMSGPGVFGGKFGALNYLACSYANETDVDLPVGRSLCEFNNMWETVIVPIAPNIILPYRTCQPKPGMMGKVAYTFTPITKTLHGKVKEVVGFNPKMTYCFVIERYGNMTTGLLYDLDKRDENGDMVLHRAILMPIDPRMGLGRFGYTTSHPKDFMAFNLLYTHAKIWRSENGTLVDGFSDHVSHFYDSNLYNAFVLRKLKGFKLVFETRGGEVKIFKLVNQTN